jgi:SAM-dependent methyltransferase
MINTEEARTDQVEFGMRAPRTRPLVSCPVCETTESKLLFRANDLMHGTLGEFTYRRCTCCATVFQDPRVVNEDLELCYPEEYYTQPQPQNGHKGTEAALLARRRRRRMSILRDRLRAAIVCSVQGEPLRGALGSIAKVLAASARLREQAFYGTTDELIPRTKRRVRALDVGCGAGTLMKQLQQTGWEVEGVEWNPVGAERARRNTGRPVITGDFREADLPLASYDLILLSHVFEHLEEPIGALRRIKELLAADGRAALFYSNPQSLGARILGKWWFCWEMPRHLVMPPVAVLADAARKRGVDSEPCAHDRQIRCRILLSLPRITYWRRPRRPP